MLIEFGAGGDKVQIGDGEGFRVQDQLGRAETDVARHPPSDPFLQTPGQSYGVSLHHQVQIQGGRPQEEVAHEAAYHVEGRAHLGRCLAGLLDQFQEGGRQGVLDQLGDLRSAGALGRSAPKLDQVGAGDDADDLASLDHGHLSQAVFHHHVLQLLHRVIGTDADRSFVHVKVDRKVIEAELQGLVNLAAGQDAHDPPLLHHGEALVAVAAHHLRRLGYRGVGRKGVDAVGHDLADSHGGLDVSF